MNNVSVIVPAYCVEAQLERCVLSLLRQTHKDIQILLIDDGSPDKTGEMCDRYAQMDARVTVIHQQNAGVSVARNHALCAVTGEYLLFLDGDDALDETCVETCVREAENGTWDAVVFGFHQYLETAGAVEWKADTRYVPSASPDPAALRERFLPYCKEGVLDFVTDKLMRASIIQKNGVCFDSSFNIGGEDALFIMDLFPHLTSMKVTDLAFYQYYRRSDASMTLTFHKNKFQKYYERLLRLYGLMRTLDAVDPVYLIEQYGNYFLWSYESMFSASCSLRGAERFRYVQKNYRLKPLFPKQNKTIRAVLRAKETFADYCFSSRVALRLFFGRHPFLLWVWQSITMFAGRRKSKK